MTPYALLKYLDAVSPKTGWENAHPAHQALPPLKDKNSLVCPEIINRKSFLHQSKWISSLFRMPTVPFKKTRFFASL